MREGGYDAELYLGVVGGEDEVVVVGWYEGAPYLAAALCADGYVL